MYDEDNQEFFLSTDMSEKRLYITRPERIQSAALSPCCMGPEEIAYEMQFEKNPEILEICGMNQEGLEYFVSHYGKTYRFLYFFKCQLISDFSPLEDLKNLESVRIYWNIRAGRLWNFSRNRVLHSIHFSNCKQMAFRPELLKTSDALKNVFIAGGLFENYPLASLDCFAGMPALEHLRLVSLRLIDHGLGALRALPSLTRFDFDAGMFKTEEIAWMVAHYPELEGTALCAYNKEDAILTDVRVCGFRKPGLNLPSQQERLDKYVAAFNTLVERYRSNPHLLP